MESGPLVHGDPSPTETLDRRIGAGPRLGVGELGGAGGALLAAQLDLLLTRDAGGRTAPDAVSRPENSLEASTDGVAGPRAARRRRPLPQLARAPRRARYCWRGDCPSGGPWSNASYKQSGVSKSSLRPDGSWPFGRAGTSDREIGSRGAYFPPRLRRPRSRWANRGALLDRACTTSIRLAGYGEPWAPWRSASQPPMGRRDAGGWTAGGAERGTVVCTVSPKLGYRVTPSWPLAARRALTSPRHWLGNVRGRQLQLVDRRRATPMW